MFLSLVFSPEHKNVFCNSCYFNKNYIFASWSSIYFITTVQSVNNITVISLNVNGILTSISRSKKSKVSKSGHR